MKNADELQNLTKAELIEAYNQVNNSLERVFSITSHDLRSPFSGLLGLSEMLASGSESISPEALQEY
ncbi:MAG TPA: hypothetical protein DCO79_08545, partial [Spirochaeta sp.]|nr:hypothetical protein [Spirochaeta sp.]